MFFETKENTVHVRKKNKKKYGGLGMYVKNIQTCGYLSLYIWSLNIFKWEGGPAWK